MLVAALPKTSFLRASKSAICPALRKTFVLPICERKGIIKRRQFRRSLQSFTAQIHCKVFKRLQKCTWYPSSPTFSRSFLQAATSSELKTPTKIKTLSISKEFTKLKRGKPVIRNFRSKDTKSL